MSNTLFEFSNSISKLPIRIGSINRAQQKFLINFLQDHKEIKNIFETGFHVGLSAAVMMEARPDIRVISSDIFWFDYTRKAKLILDIYYPGRSTLLAGNSVNTLPTFFNTVSYSPDFVFIDGGHERPVPYIDLHHVLGILREGTPVMIDDYCEEHGLNGVIDAVNRCIQLNLLERVQVYKSEDRGWVLGYRSATPMPPPDIDLSPDAVVAILKDIESHYP